MRRILFTASTFLALMAAGCVASPSGSTGATGANGGSTTGRTTTGGDCPPAQSTVEVDTDAGPFVGTLQTPAGCGPVPLVIIYPGSGPTDRNGNDTANGLDTDAYQELAASLATNGIASVRYDKRCVGASVCGITNEADFTFDDEVADGRLWAQQYLYDPRFTGLTLAGHSEGSLWAILIAEQVPVNAVISLEGPGRSIGAVLGEQLATALANNPSLLATANQILASLEAGMTVADVPVALQSVFAPELQPYLISWMKYDPAKEIAKLGQPILVVQGTTDAQVDVQDANLLVAANSRAQLLLIQGMCHMLKDAPLPLSVQTQAYTNPTVPLDATLVTGVSSFVKNPAGG